MDKISKMISILIMSFLSLVVIFLCYISISMMVKLEVIKNTDYKELICSNENSFFLSNSKEYFHKFKNEYAKIRTNKFKITIICEEKQND